MRTTQSLSFFFFFNDTATTEIYTLSLHDALPICHAQHDGAQNDEAGAGVVPDEAHRSEEHTSELQSPCNLVCRLLLEKKKKNRRTNVTVTDTTVNYCALHVALLHLEARCTSVSAI